MARSSVPSGPAISTMLASLAGATESKSFEQQAAEIEKLVLFVHMTPVRVLRELGVARRLVKAAVNAMKLMCRDGQLQPLSLPVVKCIEAYPELVYVCIDGDQDSPQQLLEEATAAGVFPVLAQYLTCTAAVFKDFLQQAQLQKQQKQKQGAGGSSSTSWHGWTPSNLLDAAPIALIIFVYMADLTRAGPLGFGEVFEAPMASALLPAVGVAASLMHAASAYGHRQCHIAYATANIVGCGLKAVYNNSMVAPHSFSLPPAATAAVGSSLVAELLATQVAIDVMRLYSKLQGRISATAAACIAAAGSSSDSSVSQSASKLEAHHVRLLMAIGLPVHSAVHVSAAAVRADAPCLPYSLAGLGYHMHLANSLANSPTQHNTSRGASSSSTSTSNGLGILPPGMLQPLLLTVGELVLLFGTVPVVLASMGTIRPLLDVNKQQLLADVPATAHFVQQFMLQLVPVALQLCSNTELTTKPDSISEKAAAAVPTSRQAAAHGGGAIIMDGEVTLLLHSATSLGTLLAVGLNDQATFKQLFQPVMTAQLLPALKVLEASVRTARHLTIDVGGWGYPDYDIRLKVLQGTAAATKLVSSNLSSSVALPTGAEQQLCSTYVSCLKLADILLSDMFQEGELLVVVTDAINPTRVAAFLPSSTAKFSDSSTLNSSRSGASSRDTAVDAAAAAGRREQAGLAPSTRLTVPWAWAVAKGISLAGNLLNTLAAWVCRDQEGRPINLAEPLRSVSAAMAWITEALPALGVPDKTARRFLQQQQMLCEIIEHEADEWAAGRRDNRSGCKGFTGVVYSSNGTPIPAAELVPTEITTARVQLATRIKEFGLAVAAELPCGVCCNNPECRNTTTRSEVAAAVKGSRCGGCRTARYCSEDCRVTHWKSEKGHKTVCRRMAKAAMKTATK